MNSRDANDKKKNNTKDAERDDDGGNMPPEEEKDMLFLIEFLVDTLLLKPEKNDFSQMDPCLLQGQTCVVLTFLHFPPMCICETDFNPCEQTGKNCIKFNAGKSLMFALSESDFENPERIFLEIGAQKVLPHGSVPNRLNMGVTKICLTELFKQVFEKVEKNPNKLPISKSIKDNYKLFASNAKWPSAEVTIYIRLSCLGQNVVTEFQRGNDDCEPLMFRGKESRRAYECTAKDLKMEDEAEDLCPPVPGWGEISGRDCGDGVKSESRPVQGKQYGQQQQQQQQQCCCDDSQANGTDDLDDDDEFDEFGTEAHGHALTIKIQKSQKKISENGTSKSTNSDDGFPGHKIGFQIPESQQICKKGKAENKARMYRVNPPGGGKNGECGNEPIQIVQGVDSPDKDIFFLRIGKKGESYGKGKLELELRTPKIKIERPIDMPRRFDKMIQTEKEDKSKKKKKKK